MVGVTTKKPKRPLEKRVIVNISVRSEADVAKIAQKVHEIVAKRGKGDSIVINVVGAAPEDPNLSLLE
jgi:hypothetical protein